MTNTINKCKDMACTHSGSIAERWTINPNGSVQLTHGQKWHFCNTCDKVVHKDYIRYHEMRCAFFHETAKNCIAKGHYENGTHGRGVACNL